MGPFGATAPGPSRRPRAQFVRVGDYGLGEIVTWVLGAFPGLKQVRSKDGQVVVEQVLSGWIDPDGQVRGEARTAVAWPGVLSFSFHARAKECLVERFLRYDEVPAGLWGPTVA